MVVLVTGCTESPRPAATVDAGAVEARAVQKAAPRDEVHAVSAIRCAECHEVAQTTWQESAHARSAKSPLFKAMKQTAPADAACETCHAPLETAGVRSAVAQEGVTCDVCHTISAVTPSRSGAALKLNLADTVKYGPLCDAKDHYFHKMGCSPLHQQATLCAGCHLLYRTTDSGTSLPVYTEYEEWQGTVFGESETACQTCHMDGSKGEVAVGAGERNTVHTHGLMGASGKLRQKALSLKLDVRPEEGRLRVEATVENREAGHFVPTGVPGRRVVLAVRTLDAQGNTVADARRAYGRVLVDDRGVEVPWFRATKLQSDNRLAPDEPRVESFLLDAPSGGGRVEAKLWWTETTPELAAALGVLSPREELLVTAAVPFGAPTGSGGRKLLPAAVEVNK